MKKLRLRAEVLRELDSARITKVRGGLTGMETYTCPTLNGCKVSVNICVRTLQGCTTAVDCP